MEYVVVEILLWIGSLFVRFVKVYRECMEDLIIMNLCVSNTVSFSFWVCSRMLIHPTTRSSQDKFLSHAGRTMHRPLPSSSLMAWKRNGMRSPSLQEVLHELNSSHTYQRQQSLRDASVAEKQQPPAAEPRHCDFIAWPQVLSPFMFFMNSRYVDCSPACTAQYEWH